MTKKEEFVFEDISSEFVDDIPDLSTDIPSDVPVEYVDQFDGNNWYRTSSPVKEHDHSEHHPTDYGVITSLSGMRDGEMHEGVDIRAYEGTPINAFKGGIVKKIARKYKEGSGPGKHVFIEDPDTGELHKYFHLSKINDDLKIGQAVSSGQQFGLSGNTGGSRGAHLHFEVHRKDDEGNYSWIDPVKAYPEHFKKYINKATGKPVNIDAILKANTRVSKPES
jgi:murein DD-endopeptidase MepM/ murein hydrolase activator NlpD